MPSLTIETITPETAAEILAWASNNRPLRPNRVSVYATEMKGGRWLLTGEPIIFNGTNLINGQHRLHACVEAGVPFTTAVFRGAVDDVYNVVDSGLGRTAGDALKHAGIVHYNVTAASARLVLGYESNSINDPHTWATNATRSLILDEVEKSRDRYAIAAQAGWQARTEGYNASAFTAFTIILGRATGEATGDEWIAAAVAGVGLEAGDPRLALRRWIVGTRGGQGPVHLSAWIRARNAYVKNESRTIIKSWFKGTPFPRLIEEST